MRMVSDYSAVSYSIPRAPCSSFAVVSRCRSSINYYLNNIAAKEKNGNEVGTTVLEAMPKSVKLGARGSTLLHIGINSWPINVITI